MCVGHVNYMIFEYKRFAMEMNDLFWIFSESNNWTQLAVRIVLLVWFPTHENERRNWKVTVLLRTSMGKERKFKTAIKIHRTQWFDKAILSETTELSE